MMVSHEVDTEWMVSHDVGRYMMMVGHEVDTVWPEHWCGAKHADALLLILD